MKILVNAFKELITGKPFAIRSSKWQTLRKNYLKTHGSCAACGSCLFLEVHHIKPYHLYKELELDERNLMTLCETPGRKCHLYIGHNGNWRRENINVVVDALKALEIHNRNKSNL